MTLRETDEHIIDVVAGDDGTPVEVALLWDGQPYDMSEGIRRVEFEMWGNSDTVVSGRAEVVDEEEARVRYEWKKGDMMGLEPRVYESRFRVVTDTGSVISFPAPSTLPIKVIR